MQDRGEYAEQKQGGEQPHPAAYLGRSWVSTISGTWHQHKGHALPRQLFFTL